MGRRPRPSQGRAPGHQRPAWPSHLLRRFPAPWATVTPPCRAVITKKIEVLPTERVKDETGWVSGALQMGDRPRARSCSGRPRSAAATRNDGSVADAEAHTPYASWDALRRTLV